MSNMNSRCRWRWWAMRRMCRGVCSTLRFWWKTKRPAMAKRWCTRCKCTTFIKWYKRVWLKIRTRYRRCSIVCTISVNRCNWKCCTRKRCVWKSIGWKRMCMSTNMCRVQNWLCLTGASWRVKIPNLSWAIASRCKRIRTIVLGRWLCSICRRLVLKNQRKLLTVRCDRIYCRWNVCSFTLCTFDRWHDSTMSKWNFKRSWKTRIVSEFLFPIPTSMFIHFVCTFRPIEGYASNFDRSRAESMFACRANSHHRRHAHRHVSVSRAKASRLFRRAGTADRPQFWSQQIADIGVWTAILDHETSMRENVATFAGHVSSTIASAARHRSSHRQNWETQSVRENASSIEHHFGECCS